MQVINEIQHFPSDWELILLGHANAKYDCKIKQTTINNLPDYYFYQSIAKLDGAYGYIINQKGARKILAANQKIYKPIDHFTGDYKTLNFYAIYPQVVNVDFDIQSSIGDERFGKKDSKKVRLQEKSRFLRALSSINQKRKDLKWFRKLECFGRKVLYKL